MRSPDDLTSWFRAQGLKVTPQRRAVFEALHGDDSHPTADVIWDRVRDRMPTVSLRTVYQALNDLVELGEVQMVGVGNGAVRFDPNIDDHDHFVCRNCGRVSDVLARQARLVSGYPGPGSGPAVGRRGRVEAYTVDRAEIIFRGLCPACPGLHRSPGHRKSPTVNPSNPSNPSTARTTKTQRGAA